MSERCQKKSRKTLHIHDRKTTEHSRTITEQKWQEQVRILKKSTEIELDMKTNLIEEQQR